MCQLKQRDRVRSSKGQGILLATVELLTSILHIVKAILQSVYSSEYRWNVCVDILKMFDRYSRLLGHVEINDGRTLPRGPKQNNDNNIIVEWMGWKQLPGTRRQRRLIARMPLIRWGMQQLHAVHSELDITGDMLVKMFCSLLVLLGQVSLQRFSWKL